MNREIVQYYFYTHCSICTIAGIYKMKKSEIGKIIQRYKKKHNIR